MPYLTSLSPRKGAALWAAVAVYATWLVSITLYMCLCGAIFIGAIMLPLGLKKHSDLGLIRAVENGRFNDVDVRHMPNELSSMLRTKSEPVEVMKISHQVSMQNSGLH